MSKFTQVWQEELSDKESQLAALRSNKFEPFTKSPGEKRTSTKEADIATLEREIADLRRKLSENP